MEPTLYELLNIPLNADLPTIETAYLARLQQVMYDGEASRVASEVLQLTRAYGVLMEVGRRAAYDHVQAQVATAHHGYDATCEITLTAAEACMGTTRVLSFHQPDGRPYQVSVPIPPGSRHGDRIRLPGQGGPSLDNLRRGDLVAKLVVQGYYVM
jgi:DnaJ-class molecular chaperone